MDEGLKRYILRRGVGYATDLLERQFACQHHLLEARLSQKGDLLRRTVVHLRAGMQCDRREVKPCQSQVLHDERVHARVV